MIIFKNTGAVFRGMGIVMIIISYLIPSAMPKFVLAGLSLLLSGCLADKVFDKDMNASSTANAESVQKKSKITPTKCYHQNEAMSRGNKDDND